MNKRFIIPAVSALALISTACSDEIPDSPLQNNKGSNEASNEVLATRAQTSYTDLANNWEKMESVVSLSGKEYLLPWSTSTSFFQTNISKI